MSDARIGVMAENAARYNQFMTTPDVPCVGSTLEFATHGGACVLRIATHHGHIGYPTTIRALREAVDQMEGALTNDPAVPDPVAISPDAKGTVPGFGHQADAPSGDDNEAAEGSEGGATPDAAAVSFDSPDDDSEEDEN